MLATVASILVLARASAGSGLRADNLLLALLGAPAAVVVLGALYEWIVHRFVYHGPSPIPLLQGIHEVHGRGHHWHRFPPDRYVAPGPVERIPVWPPEPYGLCGSTQRRALAWGGQYALYLSVAIPFAFAPVALFTRNALFTSSFVLTSLVVCYLFIHVHDVIHYPCGRWIEQQRWLRFLDRHHYIHHIDNSVNLNFLLPLGDLLLGTLCTRCSPPQAARWPSFEVARQLSRSFDPITTDEGARQASALRRSS